MANKKTTNRRQYTDVIFFILIGLCIAMVAVYQLQGAVSVLTAQPESTLVGTSRANNQSLSPTRALGNPVSTLRPTSTVVVPRSTLVIPTSEPLSGVSEEDG